MPVPPPPLPRPQLEAVLAKIFTCAICLSDNTDWSKEDIKIVHAPCRHKFCAGCLEEWTAAGHRDCPMCRRVFALEDIRPAENTVDLARSIYDVVQAEKKEVGAK